ncbi:MFS transporter [Thiohalophilus thiocyanatoxydans]|uniref:UMF1 family MFS transporter n=1 Tax=Thiohalophilus thiocyanatoxydans TaxID=381308 RepID=A0A4R8IW72_9GAMM|nr:MFS transporter [Thiohalophilus thiocyanatoxydans]TDY01633.1 UMF1 family MFS transporter [Thiohalophilus thiocyanatoxydans]
MWKLLTEKKVLSWALYDWANSAFATVMLAGLFPIFFKEYLSADQSATTSTFHLGVANSAAGIVIVLLAPILGAIADAGQARKRLLLSFASLGMIMTVSLYGVAEGAWLTAAILYALGVIGFMGSLIFYDALIVKVARPEQYDLVSGYGYSLGYLGGGLLFSLDVLMTLYPAWFGFADAGEAVRFSFITVAIWWAVFTLPLVFNVPADEGLRLPMFKAVRGGFRQLRTTFQEIRKLRVVSLFLLAYWLYIDGVDTVVRMAVDYGMSIGFDSNDLIIALLITQFVGFPAALLFGMLGQKIGPKAGILIALGVYFFVTTWAYFMEEVYEFYMLAVVIGLVQGGVQSLSRSLYARIIPPEKSGEFFGFYNMMGKFAAVIGPVMMGTVAMLTDSSRLGILSITLLFALGGGLLLLVNVKEGERIAGQL